MTFPRPLPLRYQSRPHRREDPAGACARTARRPPPSILIPARHLATHADPLTNHDWQPASGERVRTAYDRELLDTLAALGIPTTVEDDRRPPSEHAQRVAAIELWYRHDWLQLDPKLRTSIVEGVSVFLSMFDLPDVARVFCPARAGAHGTRPRRPASAAAPAPRRPPPPASSSACRPSSSSSSRARSSPSTCRPAPTPPSPAPSASC